mgnify:CR=1 FL=1
MCSSDLRTFITSLANKGISVRVLASLAGHSSIAITQAYIDVNDEPVDESDWISPTNITKYGSWNRESRKYEGREEEANANFDPDMVNAVQDIRDFLSHFDDDFFLSQFGDHAKITITADGVSIDEYEHE